MEIEGMPLQISYVLKVFQLIGIEILISKGCKSDFIAVASINVTYGRVGQSSLSES